MYTNCPCLVNSSCTVSQGWTAHTVKPENFTTFLFSRIRKIREISRINSNENQRIIKIIYFNYTLVFITINSLMILFIRWFSLLLILLISRIFLIRESREI